LFSLKEILVNEK
jgi:hypothetical protein